MDTSAEEGTNTRLALECLKPFLRKRRAYIEETGSKFSLASEVEKINFYLNVIDDPLSVRTHGVTQLRNFLSEIHEMDYRNPIPINWKSKTLDGTGGSAADKLRAKNREYDEWKKTERDEWGTSSMLAESEKRRKAMEEESWSTSKTPISGQEERKQAPQTVPWGDTNVSSSTTTRTEQRTKSDEIPDWLKPDDKVEAKDGNPFFERRRQPKSQSLPRASSAYSTFAQEQAKFEGPRRFNNYSAQKTRNRNEGHWFFDSSQEDQERSNQRQPVSAQAQQFAAQSQSVPVTPIFVQMHPGTASSIYEPGRGVMYVPISMPVPNSVPYGGAAAPMYTDARPSPSTYNNNLPPRNPQPAPVHPPDYSNTHGSKPRYSPYPLAPAQSLTYTYEESHYGPASPPPRPPRAPSSTNNPRPHTSSKPGKKSFHDIRSKDHFRNNTSSNYINGRRPTAKPPLTFAKSKGMQKNVGGFYKLGQREQHYEESIDEDDYEDRSTDFPEPSKVKKSSTKPPLTMSLAMKKRMETNVGGFYKLGQREKHYEESISDDDCEDRSTDPESSKGKKSSAKAKSPTKEPFVITETIEKMVRQQLKKKAADKLLKNPEEVLRFCKLFGPKSFGSLAPTSPFGVKNKLNEERQQPSKIQKVQQQTGFSPRKRVARTSTSGSSSERSDVGSSSSSSDVGSAVNVRPPRRPASKKIPTKQPTNKTGHSVQRQKIQPEKRNKNPVCRGAGSSVSDVRSIGSLRSSSSSDVGSASSVQGHGRQLRSAVDRNAKKNDKAGSPTKSVKQVAVKSTKSKSTGSRRDKDDTQEQESSTTSVTTDRSQLQNQEREAEKVYSMLKRTMKTFKPRFTPAGNQRIGAHDLVTNVGLGKIKLESDYISPVVEKQECMKESNVEELDFDPFFDAVYPEISLKVEEGVSLQVETERDHSEDVASRKGENDDEINVPVSVEQQNQNSVEEGVSLQAETDRVQSEDVLGGERDDELESMDLHDASVEEQNMEDEDVEQNFVIGNVVSLKAADVGNETQLNMLETKQALSSNGDEQNKAPEMDEEMELEFMNALELQKNTTNEVEKEKNVASVDEEQKVEPHSTDLEDETGTVKPQPSGEAGI